MSEKNIESLYFDYAATTPLREEVFNAMQPFYSQTFNNASSIYRSAQKVKNAIEEARRTVADLLKVKPNEIFFTSGGTESNNWAIFGTYAAYKYKKNKLITSKYEHHSVLKSAEFIEYMGGSFNLVNIKPDGCIDIDDLNQKIDDNTYLVSIMTVNNELGSINPISEIADVCRSKNVLFHTDAVAAAGYMTLDVSKYDILSLSAHKFYGPKGIGILYIRNGTEIKPLLYGGEQESGRRAGTENAGGIIGCAKALELAVSEMKNENKRLSELRDYFKEKLAAQIPNIVINNDFGNSLPNYINLSLPNVNSQIALITLDLNGIECSNGSACMSGGSKPSHVLKSLNLSDDRVENALRFTMGKGTTKAQIDKAVSELKKICSN